jgi:hypothetical protein
MSRGERPTGEGNGKSRWIHSEGENFLRRFAPNDGQRPKAAAGGGIWQPKAGGPGKVPDHFFDGGCQLRVKPAVAGREKRRESQQQRKKSLKVRLAHRTAQHEGVQQPESNDSSRHARARQRVAYSRQGSILAADIAGTCYPATKCGEAGVVRDLP